MRNNLDLFLAFGLGAGAMFLFDPVSTGRRRALLRDKAVRGIHVAEDAAEVTARDLLNRGKGVVAETRRKIIPHRVSDEVLIERVRSKLGRCVSHPHAIKVTANQGVVTLSGLILQEELKNLISGIERVDGVKEVLNRLEIHNKTENIPALQGGKPRKGERIDLFQDKWSPSTWFLVSLATGSMIFLGSRRELNLNLGERLNWLRDVGRAA